MGYDAYEERSADTGRKHPQGQQTPFEERILIKELASTGMSNATIEPAWCGPCAHGDASLYSKCKDSDEAESVCHVTFKRSIETATTGR